MYSFGLVDSGFDFVTSRQGAARHLHGMVESRVVLWAGADPTRNILPEVFVVWSATNHADGADPVKQRKKNATPLPQSWPSPRDVSRPRREEALGWTYPDPHDAGELQNTANQSTW
jgi:hypothetical protein